MNIFSKIRKLPVGVTAKLAKEAVVIRAQVAARNHADYLKKVPELQGDSDVVWRARSEHLNLGVEYALGAAVQGDFVEFGTCSGTSATAIAASMAHRGTKARLHLLDSFIGFPKAEGVDKELPFVKNEIWGEGRMAGFMTPEKLRKKLSEFLPDKQIVIYEGWYKDTAPKLDCRIALIHADCDLYQSTMDALTPCFQNGLVSEGAVILFDDWDCNLCRNDWGQRRAWRELTDRFKIEAEDWGSYGAGQHKFMVRSYRGMPKSET